MDAPFDKEYPLVESGCFTWGQRIHRSLLTVDAAQVFSASVMKYALVVCRCSTDGSFPIYIYTHDKGVVSSGRLIVFSK